MIIKFSVSVNEARRKLKPLGLALFYVYILFAAAGGAGFLFGGISMILKLLGKGLAVNSSWLELVLLTVICGFMVKFFLRESACLVRMDKAPELPEPDHEVAPPPVVSATVIPFKRNIK